MPGPVSECQDRSQRSWDSYNFESEIWWYGTGSVGQPSTSEGGEGGLSASPETILALTTTSPLVTQTEKEGKRTKIIPASTVFSTVIQYRDSYIV